MNYLHSYHTVTDTGKNQRAKNVCQQLNALCRETIASLTGYPFILSALEKLNL